MCIITFKDGVVVDLHEDCTVDIVEFGTTDDVELVLAILNSEYEKYFNIINERLGGIL